MTALLLTALIFSTSSAERFAGDAVIWAEIPNISQTFSRFEATPLRSVYHQIFTASERKLFDNSPASQLLAAIYYNKNNAILDWQLVINATSYASKYNQVINSLLLRMGYKTVNSAKINEIVTYEYGPNFLINALLLENEIALSPSSSILQSIKQKISKPLSSSPSYVAKSVQAFDLRGGVDMQRYYGILAHQKNASLLAGILDRLGMLEADLLTFSVNIAKDNSIQSIVELSFKGQQVKGLRSVIGPTVLPQDLPKIPVKALGYFHASIAPLRLYEVVTLVANYLNPLEMSLLQTQLSDIEQQLGKSVNKDILGEVYRIWTLYFLADSKQILPVLQVEVADADATASFLSALTNRLPILNPDIEVQKSKIANIPVYLINRGNTSIAALGLKQNQLFLTTSQSLLYIALTSKAKLNNFSAIESASVYAHMGAKMWSKWLQSSYAGRKILSAAAVHHISKDKLADIFGHTNFSLAKSKRNLAMKLVIGQN
ncbi:MAG: hypothetical protein JW841_15960 [Deltaproteobacteria bacterium]|nr:hypothetical protein [Deltaproteobacteria bacterium]